MKKRILAITLALSMAAGMSMTAIAKPHEGTDIMTDGTAAGAAVEGEVTVTNESEGSSSGNTDFYLVVDKDATSEEGPGTDKEDIIGSGDVIYTVDYTENTKTSLSVTVPLYVCMYAYGGDGKVVVPGEKAYAMENSSKQTTSSKITAIYPCYKVIVIDKETQGLDTLETELKKANQDYNTTGAYGYYTIEKDGVTNYYAVATTNCFDQAGEKYFKTGDKVDSVTIDGITYRVGGSYPGKESSTSGKAVRVASIKATQKGSEWALMAAGTSLKAHEFTMTVNNLDLSKVTALTDITSLAWDIAAPTDTAVATTLSLPISAAIAGNSVNEDTHVGVVGVEYTIVPIA